MTKPLAELEIKRKRLHDYVIMKLEERDYHGVADAAMDLRELEVHITYAILESQTKMSKMPGPDLPATKSI